MSRTSGGAGGGGGGGSVSTLTDVTETTPQKNDNLTWNGTKWVNEPPLAARAAALAASTMFGAAAQ